MSSPNREHLLGYLLGALERTEHEQVEAELDQNPVLRAEIRRLEACLGRLGLDADPPHFEPPAGLAVRTCSLIAARAELTLARGPSAGAQYGAEHRRFTWSDLVVAAAVLVAAASLFLPALSYSHFQAQIAGCQNNERLLGYALQEYSTLQPDGSFPGPEASGKRAAAGIVAPILAGYKLVPNPRIFLCPGSPIVREAAFHVPDVEEIEMAQGPTLATLRRTMGGDYGYNMGYTRDDKLLKPCNSRRCQYVLAGDAPSNLQPKRVSSNHRGRGQNVLYEDGHVQFVVRVPSPQLPDDPYHNREGWVAAGLDRDDAVLGASGDAPLPVTLLSDPGR